MDSVFEEVDGNKEAANVPADHAERSRPKTASFLIPKS